MRMIRNADAGDALSISRLFASTWRRAYRGIIAQHYLDRLPEEYWVPSLRAWLGDGRFSALIAEEDGRSVGAVVFGRGCDEGHDSWGEIVSLYILPEASGKGHGAALLGRAMAEMRQEGYRRFYLWAIEGNDAADVFYRKHGFHRTGDRVAYQIGGEQVRDIRYVLVDA